VDKEISEDKYFDMLGAVPPIYITKLQSESFKGAFALGEANSHINTPDGVKPAYSAFYQVGDKYFEVDGLVYFSEPGIAHIYKPEKTIKNTPLSETEISRYTIPTQKKWVSLIQGDKFYEVIVSSTITGDRILEYPKTNNKTEVAKNYIEAIGKYSESKVISKGAFTGWLDKNELNVDALVQYAEENGVVMDEVFAKGGKAKKVSSYPRKGHVLDKFAGVEPLPEDRETKAFINTDIFPTGGDYVLGGFNLTDLGKIEVVGDSSILSFAKVKILFRERITKAVERFKQEVETNFTERVGRKKTPTEDDIQNEFDGEISNLMETYLSIKPTDTSVEAIVDLILNSESAFSWLNTIGERIEKFTSVTVFNGVTINKIDQSKVTIDDAEDHTRFASLEQILEQLHTITEKVN